MLHHCGSILGGTGSSGLLRAGISVLATVIAFPASAAQPVQIDPTKGVVAGKTAVAFWAAEGLDGDEPLHPVGFEAHLIHEDRLDEELIYPCGTWIAPPPGKYAFWIEGGWRITPATYVLNYRGSPFQGRGGATVRPVVPAGRVARVPELRLAAHEVLRLLHTESHNRESGPRPEMSRRVSAAAAAEGALMPAGRVLAGIYDNLRDEYLAIARPVVVEPNAVTYVEPAPPSDGTDLLVVLERPEIVTSFAQYDVELAVEGLEGPRRAPDVVVPTADRMFAVWYGLAGQHVVLSVQSASVYLEPVEIPLRRGKVETYRGSLVKLPDLDVQLQLPPELSPTGGMELIVTATAGKRVVATRKVVGGDRHFRFDRMPREELEVILDAPPWRFSERVDLGAGVDGAVTLAPFGLRVVGAVYRGAERHPATVTFAMRSGERYRVPIETDESGEYETLLFEPPYLAAVALRGREGGPFFKLLFAEPFESNTVLDFHLPANEFKVRVVDTDTGRGIPRADVKIGLRMANGGNSVQRETTDLEGTATLPPMREGELSLRAEAQGYEPAETVLQVRADDEGHEVTLVLRRSDGETDSLAVRLPDGSPAASAAVVAVSSLGDSIPIWQGICDGMGRVEVPESARGAFLAVKHPAAGFLVHRWESPSAGAEAVEWSLSAPAPPLAVHIKRSWGEPVGWARIAVSIEGLRVSGSTLTWLVGSNLADGNGYWQAFNLPPRPVEILAWGPTVETATAVQSISPLSVEIPYPWSGPVEIQTLD